MPGTVIHWFRKGLRLHDNPALNRALSAATKTGRVFKAIYILNVTNSQRNQMLCGANRWRFLLESLTDLNHRLCHELGCPLYVIRGEPKSVFVDLIEKWSIETITFESDIEPYLKDCGRDVRELAETHKIEVFADYYHTLYPNELIVRNNNNKVPLTYRQLETAAAKIGKPKLPVKCHSTKFDLDSYADYGTEYHVPDVDEVLLANKANPIGLAAGPSKYPGGETEALKRLDRFIRGDPKWIQTFEKPNTSPNSIDPSTTVLSPYVTLGCLSVRLFYERIASVIRGKKHSKPPVSLIGQLLWREFYYVAGANVEHFDRMVGNKICLQVPWHDNNQLLDAWAHGRTGYPFIDAIMRQLRNEGWIHHLARHAVACFLTRGDLWISWERGQKIFEELLLDADWALNAGNWLWLSASAFFHQYFRVYSPVSFGRKTDPTGTYIRKYVPELANYPNEFIFEPWKAPKSVQKQANCIIGDKYPNRIVIHEKALKINLDKMTKAYRAAKQDNRTSPQPAPKRTKTK